MIGWLDCAAGASGDMFLGALVDAGVPLEVLAAAVDTLGVGVRLRAEPVHRQALTALRVHVDAPADPASRTWRDVRALLTAAPLAEPVRATSLDVFARLAHAEAGVHGTDVEDVHFHELGALDALADVVGACAGLHHLELTALTVGRVALGVGTADTSHGRIPIPGPAVLALLAGTGAQVVSGIAPHEACTPTGAALLAAHATGWGELPPMRIARVGAGAGGRDLPQLPNVLRLVLGAPAHEPDGVRPTAAVLETTSVLETNVDDLDPRLWPAVLAAVLAAGASDAWLTPILMKKGRPAHTLHALVGAEHRVAVREAIFTHTTTIGLREYPVGKYALDREIATVHVEGRPVRVKIARLSGRVLNTSVEYEDAVAVAAELGLPVKTVLARAAAAAL